MAAVSSSSGRARILFLAVVLFALSVAVWQWVHRNIESTDDAFVEYRLLYVAPRVSGRIKKIAVRDNQFVKAGDVIAEIDGDVYESLVDIAKAALDTANASLGVQIANKETFETELTARTENAQAAVEVAKEEWQRQQADLKTLDARIDQAQREVVRYQTLRRKQQVSKQLLETSQTRFQTLSSERLSLEVAEKVARAKWQASLKGLAVVKSEINQLQVLDARIAEARAEVSRAKASLAKSRLNLGYTKIVADHDGWISKVTGRAGSQVSPQKPLAILVYGKPWIDANFKETQTGRMKIGDLVEIRLDAHDEQVLKGHVDSFQAGTGARFSLLPPENATGNFVKVVQRLPVRIEIDSPIPSNLRLMAGMSAQVSVTVDSERKNQTRSTLNADH